MRFLPTGNEFISLPTVQAWDAGIESFNFLHMGFHGLIEMGGDPAGEAVTPGGGQPLLRPFISLAGEETPLPDLVWERLGGWIPAFRGQAGDLEVSGVYLAPVDQRGFVTRLTVRSTAHPAAVAHSTAVAPGGPSSLAVTLGFAGRWGYTRHTINESKPLEGSRHHYHSNWSQGPVLDFRSTVSLFALAPLAEQGGFAAAGDPDRFGVSREVRLAPGEEAELTVFWGVGQEEVGAVTAAREMQRTGYPLLLAQTLDWLAERQRTTGDVALDRVLNLNLLFNRLYATGRCLDTEELVCVTSRSPRYYVSAAYWDRDALYWSFPGLLVCDPDYAREVLVSYVFGRQARNAGIHSRYIDGTVLEPGFELDELVAPVLAVEEYVARTGDRSVLAEPAVRAGCRRILKALETKRHPDIELYETFLLPTDDVPVYPYCTYDNVLVWKALRAAARLGLGGAGAASATAAAAPTAADGDPEAKAERLRQAIWAHCVKEGRFAWEVDLRGNYRFYDEPPGSLQLMPVYGFCDWDDPVYRTTVGHVRSAAYHHSFAGCAFDELGCSHAEHPWVLSAANSLLLPFQREHARDLIIRAPMDDGIACESIDENTGACRTGAAFATCAGRLAASIWAAYGQAEKPTKLEEPAS